MYKEDFTDPPGSAATLQKIICFVACALESCRGAMKPHVPVEGLVSRKKICVGSCMWDMRRIFLIFISDLFGAEWEGRRQEPADSFSNAFQC